MPRVMVKNIAVTVPSRGIRSPPRWIGDVPYVQLLGLGFGQDPTAPVFGARIFTCGDANHSGHFRNGSISLRNLAYIALGDPAGVTR